MLQTHRLQRELRVEHDLTQKELQESSRRLQQECDHRMALERDKVRLMEEERARLLQQVQGKVLIFVCEWSFMFKFTFKIKTFVTVVPCFCYPDCGWRVSVQAAGERIPALQRTTEHQARVQTAVRDQPTDSREGNQPVSCLNFTYHSYYYRQTH